MGNRFALCKPAKKSAGEHRKILQVVKLDGKILEFTAPIIVKDLLVNFSGFGVTVAERVSKQPLPPSYELKLGKTYHLLPSPSSTAETEQADGMKRIKVVITRQQLQELLSKQRSIQDILSGLEKKTCSSSVDSPSTCWKPKLEPIPEGSE